MYIVTRGHFISYQFYHHQNFSWEAAGVGKGEGIGVNCSSPLPPSGAALPTRREMGCEMSWGINDFVCTVWCLSIGVWVGSACPGHLDEDRVARLCRTDNRLLWRSSLHTYCRRLRHHCRRLLRLSLHCQGISRSALHCQFFFCFTFTYIINS